MEIAGSNPVSPAMNQHLEQKLFDKYPLLFQQKDLPMSQTCMCWGIECSDGWYNILDKLCDDILKLPLEECPQFTQIKEKFGGLRIYVNYATDEVYKLIDKAGEDSLKVCEMCGNEGVLRHRGSWLATYCGDCSPEGYVPCEDDD